jgi:2-oxoglutarate dehydrogenase E2 component (dihydrolipoamide succinyltransferase)
MLVEVLVPQLSESVAEATLLSWHKKIGQAVTADENMIDIETDKVVLELPAPASGVLTQVLAEDGATVVAGQVIAMIDTEAQADANTTSATASVATPVATTAAVSNNSAAGIAMPAAAKILAEKGVSAADVAGTGKDGRVTKADAMASTVNAQAALKAAPATTSGIPALKDSVALPVVSAPINVQTLTAGRPEQRVPMSRLRQRVAERLVQSQQTNAILTTFNEVNMQPVIDMRNKFKDKFEKEHGTKLGFMSFFVKAATQALKKYPVVNASIDGNDIVYHGYFDIGVAVGSPRGLVVPVLRNTDQMNFADVEKQIAGFGSKAKDGKLSMEELTGGTFSISNGGTFGSMLSTPIINPPQSAILGVHATKDRAVVENGQVVVRPINYLALSYDHRIIDGREAVLFLVAIKEALEDPARLLLDL